MPDPKLTLWNETPAVAIRGTWKTQVPRGSAAGVVVLDVLVVAVVLFDDVEDGEDVALMLLCPHTRSLLPMSSTTIVMTS